MKGMRSKASAGGMDIDFGDALYNDAIDMGDPDVPMMEGDPTEKVRRLLCTAPQKVSTKLTISCHFDIQTGGA